MRIMDLRTGLFCRVHFVVFLLYFMHCHTGASVILVKKNMLEAITACDSVKFLRNSSYTNQCSSLLYPIELPDDTISKDRNVMCMTLSHITNKMCEMIKNDKTQITVPKTPDNFDEEIKKLEPKHEDILKVLDVWCQDMISLFNVSIQKDTNVSYIKYASDILLDRNECVATCHVHHGVNPLCMVFVWFNNLYNTLSFSKKPNISKETISKQEPFHKVETNDALDNINLNNNNEHASVTNTKVHKEQSNLVDAVVEVPNNLKSESIESANEQELKNNMEQSETPNREVETQDSKLPSSTDDKLNIIENKVENPKADFQETNSNFVDEELKKANDEALEGEIDHGIMETNKKDSSNDLGDQHRFPESPVTKEEDESHFFIYFSIVSLVCVILYIGYHNKQKILAMVLEGRQSKRSRSNRRRPNTANYRKLDSNLEEAVTSQCSSNVTHVIY